VALAGEPEGTLIDHPVIATAHEVFVRGRQFLRLAIDGHINEPVALMAFANRQWSFSHDFAALSVTALLRDAFEYPMRHFAAAAVFIRAMGGSVRTQSYY
jgi:hypothetical protein